MSWWEQYRDRLDAELADLDEAGIPYELIEQARDDHGVISLRVRPTVGGRTLDLVATYPDLYPYFRVEVAAPGESLGRHHSPATVGGNLCLLGRRTDRWHPDMTLAWLLTYKLPTLLQAVDAQGTEAVAGLEEHQGEPFSSYYDYRDEAFLLVDSSWQVDALFGQMRIGYAPPLHVAADGTPIMRGAVLEVTSAEGATVARAPDEWWRLFPSQVLYPFARIPAPADPTDLGGLVGATTEAAGLRRPVLKRLTTQNKAGDAGIVGVLFEEEVRWQQSGDAWVFAVYRQAGREYQGYFCRAYRYGKDDLAARVPELSPLASKKVVIAGVGGLGAPSALEFARAGVGQLVLIDHDTADPAASVRWPLGLPATATPKVGAVASFIRQNYPYVNVSVERRRIGAPRYFPEQQPDPDVLASVLEGADLVYDATAEFGVHHVLSALAAEREIPFVYLYASRGGHGGFVARVRPWLGTGCWNCLQRHIDVDATIEEPPADPAAGVQPLGCADPTFTAAGFDMAGVALAGVRLGVSTLCDGTAGGYPHTPWDVQTMRLRSPEGSVSSDVLTWKMRPHPECCG